MNQPLIDLHSSTSPSPAVALGHVGENPKISQSLWCVGWVVEVKIDFYPLFCVSFVDAFSTAHSCSHFCRQYIAHSTTKSPSSTTKGRPVCIFSNLSLSLLYSLFSPLRSSNPSSSVLATDKQLIYFIIFVRYKSLFDPKPSWTSL